MTEGSALAALLAETDPLRQMALLAEMSVEDKRAAFAEMLADMPADERAETMQLLGQITQTWKPETPQELHSTIESETGLHIPTRRVCEGHCAPMDMIADVFFERVEDALVIGNRGSGKTQNMGIIHWLNGRYKPKHEGATAGAVRTQANKCFEYLQAIAKDEDRQHPDFIRKLSMSETLFVNDAKVNILTGTITGVNSPHPRLAHLDEVELLRPGVYEEALNMAQDGDGYAAQNVLTSTWKKVRGLVSLLVKQVADAARDGIEAPYRIYIWCVWETTEPCPHDCDACPFADVVKGVWENGQPRTFESACKRGSPEPGVGKLKFTDGYLSLRNTVARFRKLSKRMWEAQQESRRPTAEGLIYEMFDEGEMVVYDWYPDPALGELDGHVDYGATNPTAIGLWQKLDFDVVVVDPQGRQRRIPEGAHVMFDELYLEQSSSAAAGVLLNQKLNEWEAIVPGFRDAFVTVHRDPAATQASLDWLDLPNHAPGDPDYQAIFTTAVGGAPVEERIQLAQNLMQPEDFDTPLFYVDNRCEAMLGELGSYERHPITKRPVKENDHHMDGMGYRLWNRHLAARGALADPRGARATPVAVASNRRPDWPGASAAARMAGRTPLSAARYTRDLGMGE